MTGTDAPARIGLIGAGNIARRYVAGMARFDELRIAAIADAVPAVAETLADEVGVPAMSLDRLLDGDDVDVVVNITPPSAHAGVSRRALGAGKHVYSEKPIADTLASARTAIDAAHESGLVFGVAPDTFLGSAGRTARRAIDDGLIGVPLGASMFVTHSRAETWHPDPTFLFQPGGGPLLDLGPYYVTAIINLLGPVAEVAGFTRIGSPERIVTSPERRVDRIEVSTPTHAVASLRLASGALVTAMMSFDVWDADLPRIEVYGTEGTLGLPDPNQFDGPVRVRRHADDAWTTLPPVGAVDGAPDEPAQYLRGYGVADLVRSLTGEPLRVSAELGLHVLETLEAVQRSSDDREIVRLHSTVERPAPVS